MPHALTRLPDRSDFRPGEWRLIQSLRTPKAVQRFLYTLPYNREKHGDTIRTFRCVLRRHTAHCLEGALTAATILEQHGYPPLLLDMGSLDKLDHVVFLFRENGKWGTVGKSRYPGLMGRKPVFSTIRQLVLDYVEPFVDHTGRLISYNVADLRDLPGVNWRTSERNVWAVENFLLKKKHTKIRTSHRDFLCYLERYRQYKKRHPDCEPTYYDSRPRWL